MPFFLLINLYKADPKAMSADPPTIALFGIDPNGGKKACIEPPKPLLKPVCRAKISAKTPYNTKFSAKSF